MESENIVVTTEAAQRPPIVARERRTCSQITAKDKEDTLSGIPNSEAFSCGSTPMQGQKLWRSLSRLGRKGSKTERVIGERSDLFTQESLHRFQKKIAAICTIHRVNTNSVLADPNKIRESSRAFNWAAISPSIHAFTFCIFYLSDKISSKQSQAQRTVLRNCMPTHRLGMTNLRVSSKDHSFGFVGS